MNKIESISLGGRTFFADEEAYRKLNAYIQRLESHFSAMEGSFEIIQDVENRLAEIFMQKLSSNREIVTLTMVDEVIKVMGEPEAFDEGCNSSGATEQVVYGSKRLYRDMQNGKIGGVCAGLSAYLNLDLALVRILCVVLLLMSFGTIATIYFILWIALPLALTPMQRLEMRGEPITLANIEKVVSDGFTKVKQEFSSAKGSWSNTFKNRNRNWILFFIAWAALLSQTWKSFGPIHASYPAEINHWGMGQGWLLLSGVLLVIGLLTQGRISKVAWVGGAAVLLVQSVKFVYAMLHQVLLFNA